MRTFKFSASWTGLLIATALVLSTIFGVQALQGASPIPPWFVQLTGDLTTDAGGDIQVATGKITSAKILDGTVAEGDLVPLTAATDGLYVERIAFFTYDVATDLGTVAAHGLGVTLPAKALVTQVWYKVITQFTDGGAGTVALHCEDANNLLTAGDITGISANTITAGAATGSAATMVRGIGAACEITATVATAEQTAGKLIGWVRYVVEN